MSGADKGRAGGVLLLSREDYLGQGDFDLADCYSEHSSSFNGRLHFHDFYELSVIYEGRSDFWVNGELFPMNGGSIQLIRPSDYHRQEVAEGSFIRYYNLIFTDAMLPPELRRSLEEDDRPLCRTWQNRPSPDWSVLCSLLRMVHRQLSEEPVRSDRELGRMLVGSLIEFLCCQLLGGARSAGEREPTTEGAVRAAIRYVQQNYRRPIRLSDVADAVGLSQSYFSTLFHRAMGIRFSDYLIAYRLRIADRYLATAELTVQQVADLCGFGSAGYFVARYREHYGLTPGRRRDFGEERGSSRHPR